MQAEVVIDGTARGAALVLDEPLSYWGGVRLETGEIVDRHHPQVGESLAGRILVMPGTRGSSGGPGALAESFRLGTGPAAILLPEANLGIATAVLVAEELYGLSVPVLVLAPEAHASFRTGEEVTIAPGGQLTRQRYE